MSRGSSTAMILLLVSTAADATNTGTMGLTQGTPAAGPWGAPVLFYLYQ